jgi:NDP-sugar pyrophosphorylase family protein
MDAIKNAVILAAGMGTRLRPLTADMPKCLTEINGKPLILHALDALADAGVERVAIVIGYRGIDIFDAVGYKRSGMEIEYIGNAVYADTNTAFSLGLAGEYLRAGAYVVEGDVIFDHAILRLGNHSRPSWFTDTFPQGMTGSQFQTDETGRIVFHRIVRDKAAPVPVGALKSCGLLRLTPEYGELLADWLTTSGASEYYDDVIRRHITDAPIYAEPVGYHRWWEIDDIDDLHEAERRFAKAAR